MDKVSFNVRGIQSGMSEAVKKADHFAAGDNQVVRTRAKQAILKELNSQLQIRADKIKLRSRQESVVEGEIHPGQPPDVVEVQNAGLTGTYLMEVASMGNQRGEPDKDSTSRIPLSVARQRRREHTTSSTKPHVTKIPKKQKNVRSVVGGKHYRPDYTWNRGGRLKELRIRALARKFVEIWKKNTFGRILPSRAKEHYERHVMKVAFGEWHDMWWIARKEWGLGIRADLHNRYRLWNIVWKAWREYTLEHRVKTAKVRLADGHAQYLHLTNAFEAWKMYIKMQRAKHALYCQADTIYVQRRIKLTWECWVEQYQATLERKHTDKVAMHVWALNTTAKAWTAWKSAYHLRLHEVEDHIDAVQHYHGTLMKQCMGAWLHYIEHRRNRKTVKAYSDMVNGLMLMRQFFSHWHQRWEMECALRQHHQRIEQLSTRTCLRRAFVHWTFYVHLETKKKAEMDIAVQYHNKQLKRTVIASLRLCVVKRRLTKWHNKQAQEFNIIRIERNAWNSWQNQMESREELQLMPSTRIAHIHYRLELLRKMWSQWQAYVRWRQHRKAAYAEADVHYYMRIMPECLGRMMEYADIRKNKRQMQHDAHTFLRDHLVSRFFKQWREECHLSQDLRMMNRMAILHDEGSVIRRTFKLWRYKTEEKLSEHFSMEVAAEHYEESLCRRSLQSWVMYVTDRKQEYDHVCQATKHNYLRNISRVWCAWKQYTESRKVKKAKIFKANEHQRHYLLRKTLSGWKQYQTWVKELHIGVEAKWKVKAQLTLRWAVGEWKQYVTIRKCEHSKSITATQHQRSNTLKKTFMAWKQYTMNKAHKLHMRAMQLDHAKQVLNRLRVRQTFSTWQERRAEAVIDQLRWEQAVMHHHGNLISKVWISWQDFTKLQHRKQLLQRQCMWFHTTRLTAKAWVVWRGAYMEAQHEHSLTTAALWHWCCNLERKVIIAWFEYTAERKRKAKRIAGAMEIRRKHLLRNGATHWLAVAGNLLSIRHQMAVHRGVQAAYKTQQFVQKCVAHWRAWAAKRKAERMWNPGSSRIRSNGTGSIALTVGTGSRVLTVGTGSRVLTEGPGSRASCPIDRDKANNISLTNKQNMELSQASLKGKETKAGPKPSASAGSPLRPRTDSNTLGVVAPVPRPPRPSPRMPTFLKDSLKKDGLYQSVGYGLGSVSQGHVPELSSVLSVPPADDTDIYTQHQAIEQESSMWQHSAHNTQESTKLQSDQSKRDVTMQQRATPLSSSAAHSESPHQALSQIRGITIPKPRSHDAVPRSHDAVPRSSGRVSVEELPRMPLTMSLPYEPSPGQREHSDQMQFLPTSDSEESASVSSQSCGEYPINTEQRMHKTKHTPGDYGSKVQLLPPTAFMTRIDGSLIENGSSVHIQSHNNKKGMKKTTKITESKKQFGGDERNIDDFVSPAEEMVYIRNMLRTFQERKVKYRELCDQKQHLCDWLADVNHTDPDVNQVKQELSMIEEELLSSTTQIGKDKPIMLKLAQRAQSLVPSLQNK